MPKAARDAALALLLAVPFAVLLFTDAALVTDGVKAGLEICTELLLPSLFPFLILSSFLTRSGAGSLLGRLLGKPLGALLGLSASAVSALLLSLLCGFPVGTTTANAMLRRGEITRAEWERLLPLANNPGAAFLIGVVGGRLLGSLRAGTALFCIVWLAALLLGIAERLLVGKAAKTADIPLNGMQNASLAADLTAAVGGALTTLLPIFSFVIFFSCITTCLTAATGICRLPAAVSVLLVGLLELTAGATQATARLAAPQAFCLCAAFAGFSGLSFCMQTAAMTEEYRPALLPYLCKRLTVGAISALLALLYLHCTHEPLAPTKSTAALATATGWQSTTVLSCIFLLSAAALVRALRCQRPFRTSLPSKRKTP